MIVGTFNTFIYEPLYNALIFLVGTVPFADVGIAVIGLTVIVKLILLPLSIKATQTQLRVRRLDPELKKIKEKYKKDREKQARLTMDLYRENKINPFSGFLVLLIQIPVILGLYFVFLRGGLPDIDMSLLYSFVEAPERINMIFLSLIDMADRSATLALLAGATQYFQIKLALPPLEKRGENSSFKDDMMRSMQIQMRYVMPIAVIGIAYYISAAIALYWTTSNVFAIAQEILVKRRMERADEAKHAARTSLETKTTTP